MARRVVSLDALELELDRYVAPELMAAAVELLTALRARGFTAETASGCLSFLAAQARDHEAARPRLVWSQFDTFSMLDTAQACRDLFAAAQSSVLLSTYNAGESREGNPVLRPLAERMTALPSLRVLLILGAPHSDAMTVDASMARIEDVLWDRIWPWNPRPDVYIGPARPEDARMHLHAKCVVVDDSRALVTSANLSWSAQERNVEAGVLVSEPELAYGLRLQFERLISRGVVRRARG
ncbi:MAG: hypothetical protein IV100_07890 [Myxococcales bacterium]|nr:hypothetical protein [Myxococcales bacterium]